METKQMKVSDIKLSDNIRKDIGDITELAQSIKAHGILQPLLIVAGELKSGFRRLEAAKSIGVEEVPVWEFEYKDQAEAAEIQIVENIQRKDLTALEESDAYHKYLVLTKNDVKHLAKKVGKTEDYVLRRLAIKNVIAEVKDALQKKQIELGHVLLLNQMSKQQQKEVLNDILQYDLTVQNFSDQIRWMQKIDFQGLEFRPSEEKDPDQKTIYDTVGFELEPKNSIDVHFKNSKTFLKDMADYVESQRDMLKNKGINVYVSEEELQKAYPLAKQISAYESGYNKAVKGLSGSTKYAVVVDLNNYSGLGKKVYELEPKPKTAGKGQTGAESDKPPTKKEIEEQEKTLELGRKEKLTKRAETYKRELMLKNLDMLMPTGSKTGKVMTLWALMQPQAAGWAISDEVEELYKEIGIKKKDGEYSDYKNVIDTLNKQSDKRLDELILKAASFKYNQLSEEELEQSCELVKFDLKKHWQIDKEFLEMHSKDQILKLAKELKFSKEAQQELIGSKEEVITRFLKEDLKGLVPKVMG